MNADQHQLPGLPSQQYLSANKLCASPETSHTMAMTTTRSSIPQTIAGPTRLSPPTGGRFLQRCVSPSTLKGRSPSPLRKSLELIRVSRNEWDHRDQLISSLRAETIEQKTKLRNTTSDKESYQKLLSGCQSLLSMLDGNMVPSSELIADSLIAQLSTKVLKLNNEHTKCLKEILTAQDELDTLRGETAACNVRLNDYRTQLEQSKVTIASKESETLQLKSEVEVSHQTNARTSSMIQSLKKQLTESEEGLNRESATHSQNEHLLGQLRSQLKQKETQLELVEDQYRQSEAEKEEHEERATVADTAYEDVCFQLAESLQVEDECDVDSMMLKVATIVKENEESNQRLASLTHSTQLADLDAKANRETIMKLVSDVKKHREEATKLTPLQQNVSELTENLQVSHKEKKSLLERLQASRETIASLKQEVVSHETNCTELKEKIETIRNSQRNERDFQQQYNDFLSSLSTLVCCQSSNETALKHRIQEIIESTSPMKTQLTEQNKIISELQTKLELKESEMRDIKETIKFEKEKTSEVRGELRNIEILQRQIHQQDDKYKSFIKRCAAALKIESTTSSILAGDFAEDTILLKAEQLSQQETQALAERQSTLYTLQRKLKVCRQQLESKELHIGLLQRKVSALEERVTSAVEKETEMESTLNRGKKMTSQLDRLQTKVCQQKEVISKLKEDRIELQGLKSHCSEQDHKVEEMEKEIENLQDTKIHLSQQLADTRQKLHSAVSADTARANRCEETLKDTLEELKEAKERENKFLSFRASVHQLVDTPCSDDSLIKELVQLSNSCQKYKDLSHNLQASLRALESGFRTSYEDTLTLLKSEI